MKNMLQELKEKVDKAEEKRERRAAFRAVAKLANNQVKDLRHHYDNNMKLNETQIKEFEKISRPLIKFLNDNFHPHVKVVVDCTNAELIE